MTTERVYRAFIWLLIALLAASFLHMPALLWGAAGGSFAAGAAMWLLDRSEAFRALRRRRSGSPSAESAELAWNSQVFSFVFGGFFLVPAALWPSTWPGVLVTLAALGLALASELTPFCLARLVYVTLFRPAR